MSVTGIRRALLCSTHELDSDLRRVYPTQQRREQAIIAARRQRLACTPLG